MGGLFGVISKDSGEISEDLFYGTDYHSHCGGEFAGLAGETRIIHRISNAQFRTKFEEEYREIESDKGIGVISDLQEQPIFQDSPLGEYYLAINGLINNRETLRKELLDEGVAFTETRNGINQTELVAKLINQGDTILEGIESAYNKTEGSLSLLMLIDDSLYLVGERFPLVIGEKEDSFAVASETCAFPNLNYKIHSFPQPGEVYKIDEESPELVKDLEIEKKICSFLWVYTSDPSSTIEGVNVGKMRNQNGKKLVDRLRENQEFELGSGIPASGLPHARGFATRGLKEGKVEEFADPIHKYSTTYGRSYTPKTQEKRDRIAKNKLIVNEAQLKDGEGNPKSIILVEDSIVRGTQLKNLVDEVRKITEDISVASACPPLAFPCKFSPSTKQKEELIFRRIIKELEGEWEPENLEKYLKKETEEHKAAVDKIRKNLGLKNLLYQSLENMKEAIVEGREDLKKEHLCTYCWNGKE